MKLETESSKLQRPPQKLGNAERPCGAFCRLHAMVEALKSYLTGAITSTPPPQVPFNRALMVLNSGYLGH